MKLVSLLFACLAYTNVALAAEDPKECEGGLVQLLALVQCVCGICKMPEEDNEKRFLVKHIFIGRAWRFLRHS